MLRSPRAERRLGWAWILLAPGLLWLTLVKTEMVGKKVSGQVSRLRRTLHDDGTGGGSVGGRIAPTVESR